LRRKGEKVAADLRITSPLVSGRLAAAGPGLRRHGAFSTKIPNSTIRIYLPYKVANRPKKHLVLVDKGEMTAFRQNR